MDRRRRSITSIVVFCLLLAMPGLGNYTNASIGSCRHEGTFLIVEHERRASLIDLATLSSMDIPLDPDLVRISTRVQRVLYGFGPARWRVVRIANEREFTIEVIDTRDQTVILMESYSRRIELSASAVSPSSRFTIHLQANNVASEVTILDARDGVTRLVTIPHDADLAAYALGIVYSPDERCAAISMERAIGDGAETWLVDLESGRTLPLSVPDIFALNWV